MMSDIRHCELMVQREERRAAEAPTPEAAESHLQLAMLYRTQCKILQDRFQGGETPSPANRHDFN